MFGVQVMHHTEVIHACRHLGVDLAAGVLSRMEKMGIQPDVTLSGISVRLFHKSL